MPTSLLISRRALLASAALALVASAMPGVAMALEEETLLGVDIPDSFTGNVDAPVTIIEYWSPTCGYCTTFLNETYPRLKSDYLDTGKARLAIRPFVRNALDAVVFLVAEVAGRDRAPVVVEYFMRNQERWINTEDRLAAMKEVAAEAGITPLLFESALLNREMLNRLNLMRKQAIEVFGIQGTPAVFVNGMLLPGAANYDSIAAQIASTP
ncbi:MAG: thioredoxin domain-containing protein [Devosia nanyangense]|jgi:protein-disulfide isomerase|nr:thioredoxin domain-containing protein [Devosia nanyangense]